ncbi:MAG: hypothetical protein ABI432_14420 [Flavobacteriales bacterium]
MIRKSQLVNALFLAGFPIFGYGSYVGLKESISKGMIMSSAPFVVIIVFYLVDALYRKRLGRLITGTWWLCMLYMATLIVSMFIGLRNGIPGLDTGNVLISCLLFVAPFNAAVVVVFYNRDDPGFDFGRLVLKGIGLLVALNVVGYIGGVRSYGHSFEGRANFPYIRGIYTGAHVLAIMCLMLLGHMRGLHRRPFAFVLLLAAFVIALVFMLQINSRLSLMIFMMLLVLLITRALKVVRGLYAISLFTMPLLLSFSLLVYQVLSLPFFAGIMHRVSKEDVTTFNSRSYIWEAVGDWAWNDRTGLLLGNGYKGHYKLHLLEFAAVLWDEPHAYNLHTHSTFTEVLTAQGVFGVVLLYILFWRGFKYYGQAYREGSSQAPVFAGMLYLLFIWQIDIFCYGVDIGHAILFCLLAPLCLRPPTPATSIVPQ